MDRLSLLFSGHMIDLPGRAKPRFPPELEPAARQAIERSVAEKIGGLVTDSITGFASLARGGDILFHEICRSKGVRSVIVLPFGPDQFLATSVEGLPSGDWPARFRALWEATQPPDRHVLGLPDNDKAYAACNQQLLMLAAAHGKVHVIALWDGQEGDGPGGTADVVRRARTAGDQPDLIHPDDL